MAFQRNSGVWELHPRVRESFTWRVAIRMFHKRSTRVFFFFFLVKLNNAISRHKALFPGGVATGPPCENEPTRSACFFPRRVAGKLCGAQARRLIGTDRSRCAVLQEVRRSQPPLQQFTPKQRQFQEGCSTLQSWREAISATHSPQYAAIMCIYIAKMGTLGQSLYYRVA